MSPVVIFPVHGNLVCHKQLDEVTEHLYGLQRKSQRSSTSVRLNIICDIVSTPKTIKIDFNCHHVTYFMASEPIWLEQDVFYDLLHGPNLYLSYPPMSRRQNGTGLRKVCRLKLYAVSQRRTSSRQYGRGCTHVKKGWQGDQKRPLHSGWVKWHLVRLVPVELPQIRLLTFTKRRSRNKMFQIT